MAKEDGEGRLVSAVSGDVVKISGETIIAKVSGQVVKVSGETVVAKTSGEVAKISGEVVDIKTPTSVFTGPKTVIGSISGGIALISGDVVSVTVKADANNSGDVYLGGSTLAPYSGYGFPLAASEVISIDVDNPNEIHGFAIRSGDVLYALGIK